MRAAFWAMLVVALGVVAVRTDRPSEHVRSAAQNGTRFMALDVIVDAGATPLAAYQVEVKATAGQVKIVGIEGGEHAAFKKAPYYDPAAMQQERVIIGAFNTGADLPTGPTRVARIHVMVEGEEEPVFAAVVQTAGSADGAKVEASVTTRTVETEKQE